MRKAVSSVLRFFSWLVCLVMFAAAAGIIVMTMLGMKFYCVQTGSMYPSYPVGTMIIVKPMEFAELKENDVITFQIGGNTTVTHRVVGIDKENRLFQTKGDNNQTADSAPVKYENVVGKVVFGVQKIGYLIIFLNTLFGKILLGTSVLGTFGFYMLSRGFQKDDEEVTEITEAEN